MEALLAVCVPGLGVAIALVTVVGTLELLLLTVAGLAPARRSPRGGTEERDGGDLKVAVVVPAHDEEGQIARTVESLKACEAPGPPAEIFVVADNCSDETALRAEAAGAKVIVRTDEDRRGKGFALDHAFRTLMPRGHDIFVVVDADTVVEPGLIAAVRRAFAAGADAAQVRYLALDDRSSLRARLVHVALAGFNVVRPRGRARLGLSAGILGNGFALSRETLEVVPYEASSIVEDLEYHIRLVRAGRRVQFVDEVTVRGEMPSGGKGARDQRARWEGGRLLVARQNIPGLLGGVLRGQGRLLEPACDLMLLPLAYHVLFLLAALLVPFGPTRAYALVGLAVVGLHVLAAVRAGGGGMRDLAALAAAPFYVLWKLRLVLGIARAARRDAAWVRTDRET